MLFFFLLGSLSLPSTYDLIAAGQEVMGSTHTGSVQNYTGSQCKNTEESMLSTGAGSVAELGKLL